jgi:protein-disulfide isomerase
MRAASLASCSHGIEEGAFWRVHDVLFSAELSAGLMVRASAEAAKNRVSIDECVDQAETGRRIQADIDSARALGISSTPTVILGLRHERRVQASLAYSGVVPSSELSQQIDSLLKNSR